MAVELQKKPYNSSELYFEAALEDLFLVPSENAEFYGFSGFPGNDLIFIDKARVRGTLEIGASYLLCVSPLSYDDHGFFGFKVVCKVSVRAEK